MSRYHHLRSIVGAAGQTCKGKSARYGKKRETEKEHEQRENQRDGVDDVEQNQQ